MFKHLHFYTVHRKPADDIQDPPVLVRDGFAFAGFIFTLFWLLYHRLWFALLLNLVFLLIVLGAYYEGAISYITSMALQVGQCFLIGFEGNDWRRYGLARRGYITVDITTGESLMLAERRYLDRREQISPL